MAQFMATLDIADGKLSVLAGMPLPERYSAKWIVKQLRERHGEDAIVSIQAYKGSGQKIAVDSGEVAALRIEVEALKRRCASQDGTIQELHAQLSRLTKRRGAASESEATGGPKDVSKV